MRSKLLRKSHLTSLVLAIVVFALVFVDGCNSNRNLVVYTTLHKRMAEPVLNYYTKLTGIKIRTVYASPDAEKTGLAKAIAAGTAHPDADIFWTINHEYAQYFSQSGLLECYPPLSVNEIPPRFRDPDCCWIGICAISARADQHGRFCAAGILKNCLNSENAKRFLDFLTSQLGEKIVTSYNPDFRSIRPAETDSLQSQ
ncbi:MAG: hypothetical protein ACOYXC_10415 [Candidatus Rifleibacteriota bacterium]